MKYSGCLGGWFLVLRSVQIVFAFGVLGLASYFIGALTTDPDLAYEVAIAAITIGWVFIGLVLYCVNKLPPLAVVIIDPIIFVGWIAAVGRYLSLAADFLVFDCGVYRDSINYYYDYDYDYDLLYIQCHLAKTEFGLMVVAMVSFIPTIVLGSVALYRVRKIRTATGGRAHLFRRGMSGNNPQAPQYFMNNPAVPPVFVPYTYYQPQQPMGPPQPVYDPTGTSIRYSSPPPQQQYYTDTRYQSPPPEEERPPSSTYHYSPGQQQQQP